MTILLVDDSSLIRRMLKRILLSTLPTVTILEAQHGQEALEMLETQEIHLMFLDWNMPVMTGEELIEQIRVKQAEKFRQVKIIMATTESSKKSVVRMVKKGVNGYLIKPLVEEEVIKTLETVLGRMQENS